MELDLASLQPKSPRACRRGFTLIELLITAALILVMATLMYSRGSHSFQRRQKAACERNLATLYSSLLLYAESDPQQRFPDPGPGAASAEDAWNLLIPTYTTDTRVFVCPGTKRDAPPPARKLKTDGSDYAYFGGWKLNEASQDRPLASDPVQSPLPLTIKATWFPEDGNHLEHGGVILWLNGVTEAGGPEGWKSTTPSPTLRYMPPAKGNR